MTEKETKLLYGKRILLAEDCDISAALIAELFCRQGILVNRAENGIMALEAMKKSAYGEYKLILMDINMPKMNGLDAAFAIRQLERPDAARIPIIGISADYPCQNESAEAASYGITDLIPKPIDKDGLCKIQNYMLS